MTSIHFEEYPNCPICGKKALQTPFYEAPYDSGGVRDFIGRYYQGRVESDIFKGVSFRINRCERCDFYWHQNVLNKENLEKLYSRWIDPEKSRAKQERKSVKDRMLISHVIARQLQLVQGIHGKPKVLDFGGGWGTWALCAFALGCDVYLIETSGERVKFAQKKGLKVVHSLEEVAEDFFDLVILSQVLEHVPQPKQLLQSLMKLIRFGGGCSISVPNAKHNTQVLNKGPFQPLEHVNGFTRNSLRKIVMECGLDICKDYSLYSKLSPESLFKSLGRNIVLFLTPIKRLPLTTSIFAVRNRDRAYENENLFSQ